MIPQARPHPLPGCCRAPHGPHRRRRPGPTPSPCGTPWRGPAHLRQVVVAPPLVGVDHRPLAARPADHPLQRRAIGPVLDVQSGPAALASDHPADRRPVVVPVAVAVELVGTTPRRVVLIAVGTPFFPASWYISSASTVASASGVRSRPSHPNSWRRWRNSSNSRRLHPNSRASWAVETPWARPRRISTSSTGRLLVP